MSNRPFSSSSSSSSSRGQQQQQQQQQQEREREQQQQESDFFSSLFTKAAAATAVAAAGVAIASAISEAFTSDLPESSVNTSRRQTRTPSSSSSAANTTTTTTTSSASNVNNSSLSLFQSRIRLIESEIRNLESSQLSRNEVETKGHLILAKVDELVSDAFPDLNPNTIRQERKRLLNKIHAIINAQHENEDDELKRFEVMILEYEKKDFEILLEEEKTRFMNELEFLRKNLEKISDLRYEQRRNKAIEKTDFLLAVLSSLLLQVHNTQQDPEPLKSDFDHSPSRPFDRLNLVEQSIKNVEISVSNLTNSAIETGSIKISRKIKVDVDVLHGKIEKIRTDLDEMNSADLDASDKVVFITKRKQLHAMLDSLEETHRKLLESIRLRLRNTEVPNEMICPILQDIMKNPHVAADGHSYELTAIQSWLRHHNTSPLTNLVLPHKNLTPNLALKKMIDDYCSR